MTGELPSKPLVEAILELKWVPKNVGIGTTPSLTPWHDAGYPLFLGILYESLKEKFPFVEDLPAKQIPDELTPGVVKTRFRKAKDEWPLVQAGPGIFTLNFTNTYKWETFRPAAMMAFEELQKAYAAAGAKQPALTGVLLRYIDAIETPPTDATDTLAFLREKLHVSLDLPDTVAKSKSVSGSLNLLDLRLSFPLSKPPATGNLRIATGTKEGRPALILESSANVADGQCPQSAHKLEEWLEDAHEVIHSWFFGMIEGELLERFRRQP